MLSPPPIDVPYHRLARTERYRPWRPLLEIIVALTTAMVVGRVALSIVAAIAGLPQDELLQRGDWALVAVCVVLAALIPGAWLGAAIAGRRRPGALSSVSGRLRWRWLVRCALVALALFCASLAIALIVEPDDLGAHRWPGWSELARFAVLILVFVPLQAAGEEYLFRGTLLQAIGAWTSRPWIAISTTALGFSLVHGFGIEASTAILSMGVITAWLSIRTGGLEAAIALHAINNVTALLIIAATGGGPTWLSQLDAPVPWRAVGLDLATQLAYAWIIVRMAKARGGAA
jgi:membrane protease YdiL (CAAX protease family)